MQLANGWDEIEGKYDGETHLGLTNALRLLAKPRVVTVQGDPDDDEPPNTGCNYDPADPRGEEEGDGVEVIRRRAWLNMGGESKRMAELFLREHGHRAIAAADPSEIDDEIMARAREAMRAWEEAVSALLERSDRGAAR